MRVFARRYPIPFRNDKAISAGGGNFAPFLPLNWLPWQRPLRNWKKKVALILPNISTTTEPVFTNVSAFVDVYMRIIKLT